MGSAEDPAVANFNQSQYWSFNVTSKAVKDPARADAAYKFMEFIMRPEVAFEWIKAGEGNLPAHRELLDDPYFTENPDYDAFMETILDSGTLFWVDEKGERSISVEMSDRVLLAGESYKDAFAWGTEAEQAIRDEFFSD
jgi:multiple sugar transport system substrate-binding protein